MGSCSVTEDEFSSTSVKVKCMHLIANLIYLAPFKGIGEACNMTSNPS
jgi:hypothetical protein